MAATATPSAFQDHTKSAVRDGAVEGGRARRSRYVHPRREEGEPSNAEAESGAPSAAHEGAVFLPVAGGGPLARRAQSAPLHPLARCEAARPLIAASAGALWRRNNTERSSVRPPSHPPLATRLASPAPPAAASPSRLWAHQAATSGSRTQSSRPVCVGIVTRNRPSRALRNRNGRKPSPRQGHRHRSTQRLWRGGHGEHTPRATRCRAAEAATDERRRQPWAGSAAQEAMVPDRVRRNPSPAPLWVLGPGSPPLAPRYLRAATKVSTTKGRAEDGAQRRCARGPHTHMKRAHTRGREPPEHPRARARRGEVASAAMVRRKKLAQERGRCPALANGDHTSRFFCPPARHIKGAPGLPMISLAMRRRWSEPSSAADRLSATNGSDGQLHSPSFASEVYKVSGGGRCARGA